MERYSTDIEVIKTEIPYILESAEKYYSDLEYHNFEGHILGSIIAGRRLANRCEDAGISIDIKIVDGILAYHDANVHKNLPKKFKTYERYSASIARRELPKLNYSNEQFKKCSKGIIETTYGIKPTFIESAITKRADISNIGEDYKTFINNGIKILKEQHRRSGSSITLENVKAFQATTHAFLHGILRDDEPFGDFDLSPEDKSCSPFKIHALGNLATFATEAPSSIFIRLFDKTD